MDGVRFPGGKLQAAEDRQRNLVHRHGQRRFSGEVLLGGGTVEMRHDAALGAGSIIFNGGSLKYGAGITADISGQIQTGALASNAVLVDTNGNAVTWASLAGWMGTITAREKAA